MIDVASSNKTSLEKEFSRFQLDLDDDVFVFSYDTPFPGNNTTKNSSSEDFWREVQIRIFEMYRINESFPVTVQDFGSWTTASGLIRNRLEKWKRRRDLKVAAAGFTMMA